MAPRTGRGSRGGPCPWITDGTPLENPFRKVQSPDLRLVVLSRKSAVRRARSPRPDPALVAYIVRANGNARTRVRAFHGMINRQNRTSRCMLMRALAAIGLATSACALAPGLVQAQFTGWDGSVDASGSLLFGNASDHLVSTRLQVTRVDSTLEVRSDARFTYAASRAGRDERRVTGRSALVSLGVDYQPLQRYSPFWFGSIESSLQQQIARRVATGAGAKLTFHRRDADEASLSLALLGEHTRARRALVDTAGRRATWRTRWSVRARTRKQLNPMLRATHVTLYQPAVDRVDRFTVVSTSTVAAALTSTVALTATFHDTYDSEARSRGAISNNDGQMLFGIRAEF